MSLIPVFHHGRPGVPPRPEQVQQAQFLLRLGVPPALVADVVGVESANTPVNWSQHDMSPEAIWMRQQRKGWNRLLSVENEMMSVGWIVFHDMLRLNTHSSHYKSWLRCRFDLEPSPAWLTRHKEREHISSRIVQKMTMAEADRSAYELGVRWLDETQRLRIAPQNLAAVDKKKLYALSSTSHQLAPVGWYELMSFCLISQGGSLAGSACPSAEATLLSSTLLPGATRTTTSATFKLGPTTSTLKISEVLP